MRGFTLIERNNFNPVLVEILIKGRDTIYFGEGLYDHVYGGKQFPVLRVGCKAMRRKYSQILKVDISLQVPLQTHYLEIEVW